MYSEAMEVHKYLKLMFYVDNVTLTPQVLKRTGQHSTALIPCRGNFQTEKIKLKTGVDGIREYY